MPFSARMFLHVPFVLFRHPLEQVFRCQRAFFVGDARRDDQIDAVGLSVDVIIDPLQLHLEALRRMADGTEDAEAAGFADRSDHVSTMAEGKERKLDAELLTEFRFHAVLPKV